MAAIAGRRYIPHVVYCLPAIADILFYWIRMKVVQQLTCLTLGRHNGPAYSTGDLLNTPLMFMFAASNMWHNRKTKKNKNNVRKMEEQRSLMFQLPITE